LVDRRWHSSILDIRPFRGADCNSDNLLVVAKIKERVAVSKLMVKKIIYKDIIPRILTRRKLRNSTRLQSKISLQL
jgi:hypothetical protein